MNIEEYMPFGARPTAVLLVFVNLISIYGIFAWNWNLFIILLLFWLENIIVGVINIIKILTISPKDPASWILKIFIAPFFTVHYGAFTAAHGFFILAFFGQQTALMDKLEQDPALFASEVFIILQEYSLLWVISAILFSHLFSFFWNFVRNQEWRQAEIQKQMIMPYARVAVLHVLVIIGGIIVAALHEPTFLLVIIVLGKIALDVYLHNRSHRGKKA